MSDSQSFDCAINGQDFLFGITEDKPFQRQTSSFRRDRVDTQQNPGEQSLDSGLWIWSQNSWHLGQGKRSAEQLIDPDNEGQYRFVRSSGLKVLKEGRVELDWEPFSPNDGTPSLFQDGRSKFHKLASRGTERMAVAYSNYDNLTDQGIAFISRWGSDPESVPSFPTGTADTYAHDLIGGGDGKWYYATYEPAVVTAEHGIFEFDASDVFALGSPTKLWEPMGRVGTAMSPTTLAWAKDRLFAGWSDEIYELTGTGPALPTPIFTPPEGGTFGHYCIGPRHLYVVVDLPNNKQRIYSATMDEDPATGIITWGALTGALALPAGYNDMTLYNYGDSYIVTVQDSEVRMNPINSDGSLTLGPPNSIVLKTWARGHQGHQGVTMDARGNLLLALSHSSAQGWAGWDSLAPLGMRLDLSQSIAGNPLLFARTTLPQPPDHIPNLVSSPHGILNGYMRRVEHFGADADEECWLSTQLYVVSGLGNHEWLSMVDNYDSLRQLEGWMELGNVQYGTLENKAWRAARVYLDPESSPNGAEAHLYATTDPTQPMKDWTLVLSTGTQTSGFVEGSLSTLFPAGTSELSFALKLTRGPVGWRDETSVVSGVQIVALPAPQRTELIRVPIQLFDFQTDKKGSRFGRKGMAWEQFQALKTLETTATIISWEDFTTGEVADAFIEEVSWTREQNPTRGDDGAGGVASVTMRLV